MSLQVKVLAEWYSSKKAPAIVLVSCSAVSVCYKPSVYLVTFTRGESAFYLVLYVVSAIPNLIHVHPVKQVVLSPVTDAVSEVWDSQSSAHWWGWRLVRSSCLSQTSSRSLEMFWVPLVIALLLYFTVRSFFFHRAGHVCNLVPVSMCHPQESLILFVSIREVADMALYE